MTLSERDMAELGFPEQLFRQRLLFQSLKKPLLGCRDPPGGFRRAARVAEP